MVIGGYRAAIALLVLFAIAVQIQTNVAAGTFNPTRFFLFFTILSNLFGAVLFLVLAARWGARAARLDFARGASVAYLTVTFIIVIWLLSGADLQVAIPWVDFVLHKLFPVVVLADWLLVPPMQPITFRQGLWWLSFPLAWVAFTLLRGAIDGWYPYPFLNPANGGYGSVAFYFVVILLGFVVLSAVIVAIGNAMRERRGALQPAT